MKNKLVVTILLGLAALTGGGALDAEAAGLRGRRRNRRGEGPSTAVSRPAIRDRRGEYRAEQAPSTPNPDLSSKPAAAGPAGNPPPAQDECKPLVGTDCRVCFHNAAHKMECGGRSL